MMYKIDFPLTLHYNYIVNKTKIKYAIRKCDTVFQVKYLPKGKRENEFEMYSERQIRGHRDLITPCP